MSVVNQYGDQFVSTTGRHGVDIASQRLDELDRRALSWVLSRTSSSPVIVELGSGLGWQGFRLAMLGAWSYLYDFLPPSSRILHFCQEERLGVYFWSGDLRRLKPEDLPGPPVDLVFSQRFIHYLRFSEAQKLMALCGSRMAPGAQVFLSASGIDSELSENYPAKEHELLDRFSMLSDVMATKHGIQEKVCLYREKDMETLMVSVGFEVVEIWRSPFGNIKGVFRRREEHLG